MIQQLPFGGGDNSPPDNTDKIIEMMTANGMEDAVKELQELRRLKNKGVISLVPEHTVKMLAAFVTLNPKMEEVKREVRILARAEIKEPVLILGESGTGKELIARALHGDRKGAFVAVNCTSLPDELIEAELFGHVRGAFTGATSERIGKFAAARNGTLFLDEIGDMPLNMQSKLLRVMQSLGGDRGYRITKLGSNEEDIVDVRVVCATNQNVEQMVTTGKFREDLYQRLCTFELKLLPLRDRREDVIAIVDSMDTEKKFPREGYKWGELKGNVREIQRVIKRYQVLKKLTIQDAKP